MFNQLSQIAEFAKTHKTLVAQVAAITAVTNAHSFYQGRRYERALQQMNQNTIKI